MHSIMIKIIAIPVALFLVWTCANERAITGGPVDTVAPRVIDSNPANESVNIANTTSIHIRFSEQMKQGSLKSALQIWPNPPGGYEIKTGWTWVKVKFNKPLSMNETYLLTLDKSAQDLRGNELESTYVLAFSTGDSLNSGQISGLIFGDSDVRKNGDLLLYRKFDLPLSELRKQAADYVFQPDDNGHFQLSYLAEQSYLLFYHWDRNRNKRIDGDDYFGRPVQASVQARSDSMGLENKIWPQLIPPAKVKLLNLSELGKHFIEIRTDRPWRAETVHGLAMQADGNPVTILGASTLSEDEFALHIDLAEPLRDSSEVWLRNFTDTSGYHLDSDTLRFRKPEKLDTLSILPFDVRWKKAANKTLPGPASTILISASLPYSFESDSAFQIFDDSIDTIAIKGKIQPQSTTSWEFTPAEKLESGKNYRWQIVTRFIQSPLNTHKLDSLLGGETDSH